MRRRVLAALKWKDTAAVLELDLNRRTEWDKVQIKELEEEMKRGVVASPSCWALLV